MPEYYTWFAFLPNYRPLVAFFDDRLGPSYIAGQPLDLQHVLGALLVLLILLVFGVVVWFKVRDVQRALIPEAKLTPRTFAEIVTEMLLVQMEALMGPKEARFFLPFIGTCALFILFSNAMGLIPGLAPPTSNLNTTLACAAVVVVTVEFYGFKRHGLGYFKEFLGPKDLYRYVFVPLFFFVIEVISHLARLVSLSVRLLGNMYADHKVVGIFATLVPLVPIVVPLPPMLLGVLVIVMQAVVFSLLSMLYISLAVGKGEGEEHTGH